MIISHLVAASENNVIGIQNKIPWHLPNDLKYFKNKSWGMPVIMGRNTYESLDKPLPGRINIVLTKRTDWERSDVTVAHTLEEAVTKANNTDCKEIFIIGGGEIFKQTFELADRIYITRVHTQIEGDVFYPAIEENNWSLISADAHYSDSKHAYDYTFQVWERNGNISILKN